MGIDGLGTYISNFYSDSISPSPIDTGNPNSSKINDDNDNNNNNNNDNETTPVQKLEVDHLYIDINNMLYKKVTNPNDLDPNLKLFRMISRHLVDLITNITVKNSVFFSIDGPGPLSKVSSQKLRRLKNESLDKLLYLLNEKKRNNSNNSNSNNNTIDSNDIDNYEINKSIESMYDLKNIEEEWLSKSPTDSSGNLVGSCFTPGTNFMGYMKSFLYCFIRSGFKKKGFISTLKNVYISASDRLGEGEWKMFEMLNSSESNIKINDKIVIVSNDSDIILFSLLTKFENISVLNRDTNKMIDIGKLRKDIIKQYGISSSINGTTASIEPINKSQVERQIIVDFVNLWFLNGTDHLPKLSTYSFNTAWNAYKQLTLPKLNLETNQFEYSKYPLYNEKTGIYNYNLLREIILTEPVISISNDESNSNNNGNFYRIINNNSSSNSSKSPLDILTSTTSNNNNNNNNNNEMYNQLNLNGKLSKNSILKNKIIQSVLYYELSKGKSGAKLRIENNSKTKGAGEPLVHSIIIDGVVQERDSDFPKLTEKFLSRDHPFWKKNISIIKEKYFYKLHNIFNSINNDTIQEQQYQLDQNGLQCLLDNQESMSPNEIIELYLYGLQWNFKYFSGVCKDFRFLFPYDSMSKSLFERMDNSLMIDQTILKKKNQNSNAKSLKSFPPLLFSLLLIDYPNKSLVPSIYHSIYHQIQDYFGLDSKISKLKSFDPETFKTISRLFNKLTDTSKLTPYQISQLSFQPTLKITFNPISRFVKIFHEDLSSPHSTTNTTINKFNFVKQLEYNQFFGQSKNEMETELISQDNLNSINDPLKNYHLNYKFIHKPISEFKKIKEQNRLKLINQINNNNNNNHINNSGGDANNKKHSTFTTTTSVGINFETTMKPNYNEINSSTSSKRLFTSSSSSFKNNNNNNNNLNNLLLKSSLNLFKKLLK